MDITSLEFGILAIVSVYVYYLLNNKYRVGFLAILSSLFIASFDYLLLPYIIGYSLINYYLGLKLPDSRNKLALFRIGIVVNLSQLILLKYASFAIDPFFQLFNSDLEVSSLSKIIIPIGISYYTLQGIGYLISVNMGWEKPESKFPNFLLYITFFPKFLSGPIERSNHFLPQLKSNLSFNEFQVKNGLRIALIGFFKKVAIADQLAPFVYDTFSNLHSVDGSSSWILLLLLPIYLYFDFSGYTDIAIGLAKTFGIDLLPNFNRPFFSENVTTFWRRFHISLAAWFGVYVFRPIVFKRRKWGIYSSIYAVFITWVLFGIWHGGGWNFMILGLLQAITLNYEFFTRKWRAKLFSRVPGYLGIWIGRITVYLFYAVSLVFFFAPDITTAFTFFSKLNTFGQIQEVLSMREVTLLIASLVFVFIFLLIELIQNDYRKTYDKLEIIWQSDRNKNKIFRWTIYYIIVALILVTGSEVQQFVYFQF